MAEEYRLGTIPEVVVVIIFEDGKKDASAGGRELDEVKERQGVVVVVSLEAIPMREVDLAEGFVEPLILEYKRGTDVAIIG